MSYTVVLLSHLYPVKGDGAEDGPHVVDHVLCPPLVPVKGPDEGEDAQHDEEEGQRDDKGDQVEGQGAEAGEEDREGCRGGRGEGFRVRDGLSQSGAGLTPRPSGNAKRRLYVVSIRAALGLTVVCRGVVIQRPGGGGARDAAPRCPLPRPHPPSTARGDP